MTTFAQTLSRITGDPAVEEVGVETDLVLELGRGRASRWGDPEPGGSQPWNTVSFPFTFATAGLANGVAAYTPTVGEILYNAWVEVVTGFNGTTPQADISQYRGGTSQGLMVADQGSGWNLASADSITGFGGGPINNLVTIQASLLGAGARARQAPAKFDTSDPLILVVSQDGQKGGAAVGGTTGSGILRLLILTP